MDSKLPDTGTTIFAVMSALSEECNAINLSQGFPSFDPAQELLDLVTKYLNNGANQYAPMLGVPPLRAAIAGKVGTLLAERAKAAGIDTVVFDRGGFRYHGRVAALADAAREAGLEF